jgi:hypothetical protein
VQGIKTAGQLAISGKSPFCDAASVHRTPHIEPFTSCQHLTDMEAELFRRLM